MEGGGGRCCSCSKNEQGHPFLCTLFGHHPVLSSWATLLSSHPLQLAAYFRNGNRLPRGVIHPSIFNDIIGKCWALSPQDRPSFSDLALQIDRLTSSMPATNTT